MRTVAVLLTLLLAACTTVPGTGRSQFNFFSVDEEISMGDQAYAEVMASATLIQNGPDAAMVQRIGTRIADAARQLYPNPADRFDFEIVLINESGMVNAWCLPGGKMAVYSGLLPVTEDETSLAIVVGHEVAHAIAHHGAERMSQNAAFGVTMDVATTAMSDLPAEQRDLYLELAGAGAAVGVLLPYSRSHESEADELGLYLAAAAGYDPRAAIGLWERMGAQGGQAPPEWFSTHPSSGTRIQRLTAAMPRALEYYREAGGN
jgi:predicted Zn-dependent protease